MHRRRLWSVCALDVVFLVLGTVLLVAEGFERQLEQVHLRVPDVAGAEGRLRVDRRAFVVRVGVDAMTVDGEVVDVERLDALAARAHERGDDVAVIAVDAAVPASVVVRVIAALRRARFDAISIPVTERSER